jgi:hypothetical protein
MPNTLRKPDTTEVKAPVISNARMTRLFALKRVLSEEREKSNISAYFKSLFLVASSAALGGPV